MVAFKSFSATAQYHMNIDAEVSEMFFRRIGDLRQDHDMTQQQVADLLHCQREVYRRYEKGIREIPVSYAIVLAKHYDVSLDYLLGVSDKKK